MSHPIQPPAYMPTEAEHEIAYLRWCLREICDNHLLHISMIDDGSFSGLGSSGRSLAHERDAVLKRLLKKLFSMPSENPDAETWDAFWPKAESGVSGLAAFKAKQELALADYHCGDCVAMACSCARCNTEELYRIPLTARWSKAEGSSLYADFFKNVLHKRS
jgi:hypothetical protein